MHARLLPLLLLAISLPLRAQGLPDLPPTTAPSPSGSLAHDVFRVYLITIAPGDEAFEKFGHNMIRIKNVQSRMDISFNWGVFDFDDPDFYKNFVFGRMRYQLAPYDTVPTMTSYFKSSRTVWMNEINLTPAQKSRLVDNLEINVQSDNRYYDYDYFRDNCSTRVRDALDKVLDGQIKAQLTGKPTGHTFRFHSRRSMVQHLPMYIAIDYILGQPIDVPIDQWQESFLPVNFMQHLANVTVLDEAGNPHPLLGPAEELYKSPHVRVLEAPPRWMPWFALVGIIGGAIWVLLAWARRYRTFAFLSIPWMFFVGGTGLFASWGWAYTHHVAVYRNENILQMFPLAIAGVVLIPAAVGWGKWRKPAVIVAVATVACSLLGFVLQALPSFYQVNGQMIALLLPLHAGFALGVYRLCQPRVAPAPVAIKTSKKPITK